MSSRNAKEYLLRFNDFGGGMYLRDDQNLKPIHCIDCDNVWAPGGISLEKMPGIVLANSSDSIDGPIYGIGLYRSGSADDLIVAGGPATGSKQGKYLYRLSGTSLVRLTDVGGYDFEYTTGGENVEFLSYDGILYIQNGVDDPMKYDGSGLAYWGVPQPSGAPTAADSGAAGTWDSTKYYGIVIVFYDSVNEQEGEYSAVLAHSPTVNTKKLVVTVVGAELYRGYDKVRVYTTEAAVSEVAVLALLYSDYHLNDDGELTMTAEGTVAEAFTGGGLDDITAGSEYTGITGTVASPSEYVVTVETIKRSDLITAIVSANAGSKVVVTSDPHELSTGDEVTITNTTNYNGTYTIEVTAIDKFELPTAWIADEVSGSWDKTNTFKWAKDGGAETTDVDITTAAQTLAEGVTVTFAAKIGHTATNYWTVSVYPRDRPGWKYPIPGRRGADVELVRDHTGSS